VKYRRFHGRMQGQFRVGYRGNAGECMCLRNEFSTTFNTFLRGTKKSILNLEITVVKNDPRKL
jgi:hypothetical protein